MACCGWGSLALTTSADGSSATAGTVASSDSRTMANGLEKPGTCWIIGMTPVMTMPNTMLITDKRANARSGSRNSACAVHHHQA